MAAMPQVAMLFACCVLPADILQKRGFVNLPGIPCGVCVAAFSGPALTPAPAAAYMCPRHSRT
jgi:hypothetical protein